MMPKNQLSQDHHRGWVRNHAKKCERHRTPEFWTEGNPFILGLIDMENEGPECDVTAFPISEGLCVMFQNESSRHLLVTMEG